jgi:putative membrane protein
VLQQLPYCGAAPAPGELLARFNLDPKLIFALLLICAWQLMAIRKRGGGMPNAVCAAGGWLIAAAALLSPLCALSVALFSARIAQHMVLTLVAAPLIAMGMAGVRDSGSAWSLWMSAALFFVALWFWHMPVPYEATFTSVWTYWIMHATLFGTSLLLWRNLLHHSQRQTGQALVAGQLTFVHMGLLGAVLTLADRPLFQWHLLTTESWGLTPLQDQQLGGTIMWVPGMVLFLWATLRSVARLWESLERARSA